MADASAREEPGGGPGPPADGGTRRRADAPWGNPSGVPTTVAYPLEDGPIMVSPSFLQAASVQACTAMLTRYDPTHLLRKDVVAAGVQDALSSTNGAIHTIKAVWKYTRDPKIICVMFSNPESATAMISLKTVDIDGVSCAVSKYGEMLVRIELARVPMHATVEELVSVVGHLGSVKSITRPLVHGFEDHLVTMTIAPYETVDLAVEQKAIFRPAIFSGERYNVQYRCLTQVAVCTACRETGHMNGPKCPMKDRCLTCNERGHMRRECPKRRGRGVAPTDDTTRGADAFPDTETTMVQRQENSQGAGHVIPTKAVAPPPPPLSPDTLASTGLPPLLPEGPTAWSDLSPLSKGDVSERSRSPLSKGPSETSSAEQQKLDYVKRGAEKRARELGIKRIKFNPKDLSCIRNTSVDHSRDNSANDNANNNIPQFDGPTDPLTPPLKEEVKTDCTPSENFDGEEKGSDDSYEHDTEEEDVDQDELQHLCFSGLDDYVSESEASLMHKKDEKTARLRERLRAAQQRRNDQRRAYRERCLKASTLRVPPQLLGHRDLDWEEYVRGLPLCCWPAQVSDMIALGLMAEDDPNPTAMTCTDCKRTWHMRATNEQDEAIFEPPHILCEIQGLVCLKGHTNCLD